MRRSTALRQEQDMSSRPTVESERLARLDTAIATIQQTLDVQFKRMAAIQAELDHLSAKNRST
jgi:hypothetical protein